MGCGVSKKTLQDVSMPDPIHELTPPRRISVIPPRSEISKWDYHLFRRCMMQNDWRALQRLKIKVPDLSLYSCFIKNPGEEIPEYSPPMLDVFCNQTSEFGSVKAKMGFVVGLFRYRCVSPQDPLVIYNLIKMAKCWEDKEIATMMLEFMDKKTLSNVIFVKEDGSEESWSDIISDEGKPSLPSDPTDPKCIYASNQHNRLDAILRRILVSPFES